MQPSSSECNLVTKHLISGLNIYKEYKKNTKYIYIYKQCCFPLSKILVFLLCFFCFNTFQLPAASLSPTFSKDRSPHAERQALLTCLHTLKGWGIGIGSHGIIGEVMNRKENGTCTMQHDVSIYYQYANMLHIHIYMCISVYVYVYIYSIYYVYICIYIYFSYDAGWCW